MMAGKKQEKKQVSISDDTVHAKSIWTYGKANTKTDSSVCDSEETSYQNTQQNPF